MTIKITGITHTSPDDLVVIQAETDGREVAFGPFDRRELLKTLGAEPDETDYAEVLAENSSLGEKLSATLRERNAARAERDAARVRVQELLRERDEAVKDRDAAERERDSALEALRDAAEAPEDAPEEPRVDQDQIDRSWALERAAEVLGGLVSVGALPRDFGGAPLVHIAEWLVGDQEADRG